jgi:hypothetical protein
MSQDVPVLAGVGATQPHIDQARGFSAGERIAACRIGQLQLAGAP